jgi:hypothetical protein
MKCLGFPTAEGPALGRRRLCHLEGSCSPRRTGGLAKGCGPFPEIAARTAINGLVGLDTLSGVYVGSHRADLRLARCLRSRLASSPGKMRDACRAQEPLLFQVDFMLQLCRPARSRLNACAGRSAETCLIGTQSRCSCRDVGLQAENAGATDEAIGAPGPGHRFAVLCQCVSYCGEADHGDCCEADQPQKRLRERMVHGRQFTPGSD